MPDPQEKSLDFSAGLNLPKEVSLDIPDTLSLDFSTGIVDTEIDTFKPLDEPNSQPKSDIVGAFMEKHLPVVVKEMYNNSIEGIATEIATGRKMYSVPNRDAVDSSLARDIFIQMGSFLVPTPTNVGSLLGGGLIGKGAQIAGGKKAMEFAANQMVKKGLVSNKLKKELVDDVSRITFVEGGAFAAQEGLYSGAIELRDAIIESDFDISKYQNIKDKDERYYTVLSDMLDQSDPVDYLRGFGVAAIGGQAFGAARYVKPKKIKFTKNLQRELKPLDEARGLELGIGAEIGSIMAASPLLYGREISESQEGSFMQNLVLASGIVAAAGLPRATFNGLRKAYREGKGISLKEKGVFGEIPGKELKGLNFDEIGEIIPEAVELQGFLRRTSDVYKRVQEPLIRLTGRKGDPMITEQVALTIRDINKKQLPAGMASGAYANVDIVGKPIRKKSKKGRTVIEPGEAEAIPASLDAKINRKSIKYVDDGIQFEVEVGGTNYALDPINSDLFLKFYTSQPSLVKKFKEKNRKYFGLTYERRRKLRQFRTDANRGLNGLEKGDYIRALEQVADEYDIKKWNNLKQPPRIKDMTDVEMRLVTEQIGDIQYIRNFEEHIKTNYGAELDNLSGIANESNILNYAKSLVGSIGKDVQSPAARTAIKLISKTDRRVIQKSTERLVNLQRAFGMDEAVLSVRKGLPRFMTGYNPFRNEMLEKWITGEKVKLSNGTTISSGFDEYIRLDAKPRAIRAMKSQATKLEKSGQITKKEVAFLKRRINAIEGIKTIMDEVYDDALKAKIKVAGRKEWYMPFVIKKQIRDTIYTDMLNLNQKVQQIVGEISLDPEVALRNLDDKGKEALNKTIEDFVTKLVKSADDNKKSFGDLFNLTKKKLQNDSPGVLSDVPNYDVWAAMNSTIYTDGFKIYAPLEKSRRVVGSTVTNLDILQEVVASKKNMLDTNLMTLFPDYINGATKRIELSKTFTPDAAFLNKLIDRIPEEAELKGFGALLGRMGANSVRFGSDVRGKLPRFVIKEKDAVRLLKESFTGEDAMNRRGEFAGVLNWASNFEMFSKISVATATIPNMTQVFISALPQFGPGSLVRGLFNMNFNPQVRDMLSKSGVTGLSVIDELLGGSRALEVGQANLAKFDDPAKAFVRLVKGEVKGRQILAGLFDLAAKPFMMVNQFNKMLSGAMAEDYIRKLVMMYDGKMGLAQNVEALAGIPLVNRKSYAKNKMKKVFNIDIDEAMKHKDAILDRTYNPANKGQAKMRAKILQAMEQYATGSQIGRQFDNDALVFADSFHKPAVLFKRFPIGQAKYALDMIKFEMANGNIGMPLYLAASGSFGGQIAFKAIQDFKKWLSGDRQFYGQEEKEKWIETDGDAIVQGIFQSGVVGAYDVIVRDLEPINNLKFLAKPVLLDDAMRIIKTVDYAITQFYVNEKDLNIQLRESMIKAGPIFGPIMNAILKRYAYEGQLPKALGGPPGKEGTPPYKLNRNDAEGRRRYVVQDIQKLMFTGTGPDGSINEATYQDLADKATKLAKDWNESYFVTQFPDLKIDPMEQSPRNPFYKKGLMQKFEKEVYKNQDYYEKPVEDIDFTQYLED